MTDVTDEDLLTSEDWPRNNRAGQREIPDVDPDVVERLSRLIAVHMHRDIEVAGVVVFPDDRRAARLIVAHLRAHPADAAAVLGGTVQRRRLDRDGALVGEYLAKIDGDRDEVRPVGSWTEVPS